MLACQNFFSLFEHNTLRLPAKAKSFVVLDNLNDLPDVSYICQLHKEQVIFLGGGSNIVFNNFFSGLILKVALKQETLIKSDKNYWYLTVSAGQNWHDFVKDTVDAGMFGLENLALIPGTVGAAPVQNIGAYGLEVSQRISSVTVYDFVESCQKEISLKDCQLSYRNSIFKLSQYAHWLIIAVTFKLNKHWHPVLSHYELSQYFSHCSPSPKEIFDRVISIRNKKLPDPLILANVGSFFKNPIVSQQQLLLLLKNHPSLPWYPVRRNEYKLSAAWLIEKCGFKGKRFGKVGVYDKQALVIVNFGQANSVDVLYLANSIIQAVNKKFGLYIEIEPRIV